MSNLNRRKHMLDRITNANQYVQLSRVANELQRLAEALAECGGVLADDATRLTDMAQGIQDFRDEIADDIPEAEIEEAWGHRAGAIQNFHIVGDDAPRTDFAYVHDKRPA